MFEVVTDEIKVVQVCGGAGGAGLGVNNIKIEYGGRIARARNLFSIDFDLGACKNFALLTGAPAYCLDLFSRQQWINFWTAVCLDELKKGKQSPYRVEDGEAIPPDDWYEVTPQMIHDLCGGQPPDIVVISSPCKGYSGLLPKALSQTKKYQAYNELYFRCNWLFFEAFKDHPDGPPAVFMTENVPRVKDRGADILNRTLTMFEDGGYAAINSDHCLGKKGGLAQKRSRNKTLVRNMRKCAEPIHEAPNLPYQTIGQVIGPLPFPGDSSCGPSHEMPAMEYGTWERLACIPAGGDWRDLMKFDHEKYTVVPLGHRPRNGAMAVEAWDSTSRTVSCGAGFGRSNGASALADLRFANSADRHASHFRIEFWNGVSGTVTGATHVGNGRICVSDPSLKPRDNRHPGVYKIIPLDEVSATITGTRFGSGALAIADNRHLTGGYSNKHKVYGWRGIGGAITGMRDIQEGAPSISDPRPGSCHSRPDDFGVLDWNKTSPTVRSAGRVMNSAVSLSDPRVNCSLRAGTYGVIGMDETAPTIAGSADVHQSKCAFADDRVSDIHGGEGEAVYIDWLASPKKIRITDRSINQRHIAATKREVEAAGPELYVDVSTDEQGFTVVNRFGVLEADEPVELVPNDDWMEKLGPVMTKGNIKRMVQSLHRDCYVGCIPVVTLDLAIQHVYDRAAAGYFRIPHRKERGVWIILSPHDGAWHRPLTTYELAMLQNFPTHLPTGHPFMMIGSTNDAKHREWIGNAIPPAAAEAVIGTAALSIIASREGMFLMSNEKIWVAPERDGDGSENPLHMVSTTDGLELVH